jgi:hypothetical protein
MPRFSYAPTIEEKIESLKTHMVTAKKDLGRSKTKIDQEYLAHLEKQLEALKERAAKGGRKSRRVRKSKQSRKSRKA